MVSAAGDDRSITPAFVAEVRERLAADRRVRRRLPGGGRLHIDRRLPFLCVHRAPGDEVAGDLPRLVMGEAAYLVAPAAPALHAPLRALVGAVAAVMRERFGTFLLIELWAAESDVGDRDVARAEAGVQAPTFHVRAAGLPVDDDTVRELVRSLAAIPLRPPPLDVAVAMADEVAPPRLPPLLAPGAAGTPAPPAIGIAVQPVYRQARTGAPYPVLYRVLREGLSLALKQAAYHFAAAHAAHAPAHYHAFGRRVAVRAATLVDRELTGIARSFDFLLQVTPVNAAAAREAFERGGAARAPAFDYRPLVVDVDATKRRLWALPLERLEDPTLAHLLADSRDELDRKLTMLADRGTPRFLYGSLALYGAVDDALLGVARELLAAAAAAPAPDDDAGRGGDGPAAPVDAAAFAARAEREIAWYRERYPAMAARVHVRNDVSGLVVSQGDLLVGARLRIPAARAEALLQHEVGTHVVTYYNGLAQPLGQFATGLAGYEALQEGLAVLAEYLCGGLTPGRLRLLAARVLAAHRVAGGAPFADTFRELTRDHGLERGEAFTACMRVHRSGGLTKDAIYLRGFLDLLAYLRDGGDLQPLLVGKVALAHVPVVQELRWREYLRPPALRPRHLATPDAEARLVRLRAGLPVTHLLDRTDT